jgi:hypothetical protein
MEVVCRANVIDILRNQRADVVDESGQLSNVEREQSKGRRQSMKAVSATIRQVILPDRWVLKILGAVSFKPKSLNEDVNLTELTTRVRFRRARTFDDLDILDPLNAEVSIHN